MLGVITSAVLFVTSAGATFVHRAHLAFIDCCRDRVA